MGRRLKDFLEASEVEGLTGEGPNTSSSSSTPCSTCVVGTRERCDENAERWEEKDEASAPKNSSTSSSSIAELAAELDLANGRSPSVAALPHPVPGAVALLPSTPPLRVPANFAFRSFSSFFRCFSLSRSAFSSAANEPAPFVGDAKGFEARFCGEEGKCEGWFGEPVEECRAASARILDGELART